MRGPMCNGTAPFGPPSVVRIPLTNPFRIVTTAKIGATRISPICSISVVSKLRGMGIFGQPLAVRVLPIINAI